MDEVGTLRLGTNMSLPAGRSHEDERQIEILSLSALEPFLPEAFAVVGMREQPQNVNALPVVVDRDN